MEAKVVTGIGVSVQGFVTVVVMETDSITGIVVELGEAGESVLGDIFKIGCDDESGSITED